MGESLGIGARVTRKNSFIPGMHKASEMGGPNDEKNGISEVSGDGGIDGREGKGSARRLSYSEVAASQASHVDKAAAAAAAAAGTAGDASRGGLSSAGEGIEANKEKRGNSGSGGDDEEQEILDHEYERKKSYKNGAMAQQHEQAASGVQICGNGEHVGSGAVIKGADENGSGHDDQGAGFGIRIVVNDENGSHSHQIDIPDIKHVGGGSNRDSRGSMGARLGPFVESSAEVPRNEKAECGAADRNTRLSTTSTLKGNAGSKMDYLGTNLCANYGTKMQIGDDSEDVDRDGGGHSDSNKMFASNYDASGSSGIDNLEDKAIYSYVADRKSTRADLARFEPSRYAVEMEGVVAGAPCNSALVGCQRGLVCLAFDAQVHDVVLANGAVVDGHVPGP
ncbi:hypothetical protein AYI69_g1986 [Smittium culicis]|uniref:Uncharacterized protein n=1 Tax=Smittium culicis TaxID=133412 RepID=A0A1R1YNQ2_9FUNG|nr:hypothetical protein AYI69_g1986 [Smittium culicis]